VFIQQKGTIYSLSGIETEDVVENIEARSSWNGEQVENLTEIERIRFSGSIDLEGINPIGSN